MKQWLISILSVVLILAACSEIPQPLNITREGEELVCGPSALVSNATKVIDATTAPLHAPIVPANTTPHEQTQEKTSLPSQQPSLKLADDAETIRKVFKEGELVSIKPKVTDLDNDQVTVTFTPPLNASGEWQTKKGDAGEYTSMVTAADGKSTTQKAVLLVIEATDLPPVIEVADHVEIHEGEAVTVKPRVMDPENKSVTITFSSPLDRQGIWRSGFKDAGSYPLNITAYDGKNTVVKRITLTVLDKNRVPSLDPLPPIVVKEGQLVMVKPKATDPDGDPVVFTFTPPLNASGAWATKVGDVGGYTSNVTASDGKARDEKTVSIVVNKANKAPVIEYVPELSVYEGEKIVLAPKVTDADGDTISIIYTAPFNSKGEWQTDYDDAGVRQMTITANDGKEASSWKVKITVKDKNRSPEIVI